MSYASYSEQRPEDPPTSFVDNFRGSMPETYRTLYDQEQAKAHAAIAWRRATAVVHIEQWSNEIDDTNWICVVTDDRGGLLSLLSAAITAHSLDILAARAFCHVNQAATDEAVDFFCVRRLKTCDIARLDSRELAAVYGTILSLIQGKIDPARVVNHSLPTQRSLERPAFHVYFNTEGSEVDLLTIVADDRPGLLAAITITLSRASLSIEWSDVVTVDGRARDEFCLLERDGSRLRPQRKESIISQLVLVLSALR